MDQKEPATPTTTQPPMPAPVEMTPPAAPNSNVKTYVIIGAIVLVLAALVLGYLYWKNMQATPGVPVVSQPAATIPAAAVPAVEPVTTGNLDQTLNTTDTKVQQAVDQANTDMKALDSIDKTQDSTTGL